MKKVFLTLCVLAMSLLITPKLIAQDRLASFNGGPKALKQYIAQNATFPKEAMDNKPIDGRIYLAAEVQEDGSLDKIKVVRKLHPVLDSAALSLAQNMPKWLPAMKDGKPSKQIVSFCIPYKYDVTPVKPTSIPSFIGGQVALQKHLSANLRYPEELLLEGIEGQVLLRFTVQANGDTTDPEIVRSSNPKFNKEVLRFFKTMPKWIPAMKDNKGIEFTTIMPIKFRLPPKVRRAIEKHKESIEKKDREKIKRLVKELVYKKR